MNKKFDRVLQWGKEKMGNDAKTTVSDDFKMMEAEMQLRHEGMEKMHISAQTYVKSLSKRREGDDKEKMIPVDILGQSMVSHGEEFEDDSQFGQCLASFGRANESIARVQEAYVENLNDSWLLSLERSLAQMKEYQAARKKLENRRLAYDATLSKVQKQKKEDFRVEEELRSQRIKYEESSEDVQRRMNDIQEAERETLEDLGAFLDSELEYYEKCANILLKVKERWPAHIPSHKQTMMRNKPRTNTAHSFNSGYDRAREKSESPSPPGTAHERPHIRSRGAVSAGNSYSEYDNVGGAGAVRLPIAPERPNFQRVNSTNSYDREGSSGSTPPRMIRSGTEPLPPPPLLNTRSSNLRPTSRRANDADVFADENEQQLQHSPDRLRPDAGGFGGPRIGGVTRVASGSLSHQNSVTEMARTYSNGSGSGAGVGAKKPPPPPVSRAKKPPPPPPPVKRAGLST